MSHAGRSLIQVHVPRHVSGCKSTSQINQYLQLQGGDRGCHAVLPSSATLRSWHFTAHGVTAIISHTASSVASFWRAIIEAAGACNSKPLLEVFGTSPHSHDVLCTHAVQRASAPQALCRWHQAFAIECTALTSIQPSCKLIFVYPPPPVCWLAAPPAFSVMSRLTRPRHTLQAQQSASEGAWQPAPSGVK